MNSREKIIIRELLGFFGFVCGCLLFAAIFAKILLEYDNKTLIESFKERHAQIVRRCDVHREMGYYNPDLIALADDSNIALHSLNEKFGDLGLSYAKCEKDYFQQGE